MKKSTQLKLLEFLESGETASTYSAKCGLSKARLSQMVHQYTRKNFPDIHLLELPEILSNHKKALIDRLQFELEDHGVPYGFSKYKGMEIVIKLMYHEGCVEKGYDEEPASERHDMKIIRLSLSTAICKYMEMFNKIPETKKEGQLFTFDSDDVSYCFDLVQFDIHNDKIIFYTDVLQ